MAKKKKVETVEVKPVEVQPQRVSPQDMAEVIIKYMEENPIFVYTDLLKVANSCPLFAEITDTQLNTFLGNILGLFLGSNILEVDDNGVYSKTFRHIDLKMEDGNDAKRKNKSGNTRRVE